MAIKSFISNAYLMFYLRTIVDELNSEAKSMIPGIDRNQILTKPILLPPEKEQTRIVDKIKRLLHYA